MAETCWSVQRSTRGELLLELLSEEIPAGMQRRAIADLEALLGDKLAAAEIPARAMRGYVTPRRLTMIADGIPATQPDRTEERRGPRVGAPQPAIDGFLRSAGLVSIEECEIRDTGRAEFYFATIKRPGRPAAQVLPELIRAATFELPWPKSMRYPASSLRWIRPLTSVICLFDGEVLPLPLDRVAVGRVTRGHRFLSSGEISVRSADEYLKQLHDAHVVVDHNKRGKMIADELRRIGFGLADDAALLEEVTGLVEFPVVLAGSIDAVFMSLPPEVLTTVMRSHQKYFLCHYSDGTPAPRFLFVANNVAADGGATIIAGNERVLRARLADARFFLDRDQSVPLELRVEALRERVFHDRLGSVYERVERVAKLAEHIARVAKFSPSNTLGANPESSRRAAWLSKSDLTTAMVGEFPELQGIMGRYYYDLEHDEEKHDPLKRIEHIQIANAIGDHYRPIGPRDSCPDAPESIVVALADKIDTLVAFFAIALPPTGSRDPFALRRAALGIIRILIEKSVRLPLKDALTKAGEIFYGQREPSLRDRVPALYAELIGFIVDRLKVHLRDQGVRHDLIGAAFMQGGKAESDLVRLRKRVDALEAFLVSEDGANLLIAFRRASNIVVIEERGGESYDDAVNPALLRQAEERALFERLAEVGVCAGTFLDREEFQNAMSELARLRRPVDDFFDKVTVNCDNAALRENRLRLLSRIRATLNQVADFSQLEG